MHLKWFLRLWYVLRKPCAYLASRLALSLKATKQDSRHRAVPSCVSKTFSEPMVCLAQIVHLSCTDANTASKRTEMRFHMTHVTLEFHQVHVKWFLSLWYVQRKPCTYLAQRLALSPNRAKRVSTWASSPRSTIGCIQNDFYAHGTLA
jgi:hypothetical protein